MEQVPLPTGADVLAFLGWSTDAAILAQAEEHVSAVALAARSYCRGRGWEKDAENVWTCPEDVAVVITGAAARSLSNPTHDRYTQAGSFHAAPGSAASWSLLESYVLNGYRRRAA